MWKCSYCAKEFDFSRTCEKANHSRWCPANPSASDTRNLQEASDQKNARRFGWFQDFEVECGTCLTAFTVKERAKLHPQKSIYFCQRKCANSQGGKARVAALLERGELNYRTLCFLFHEKACAICGESNIVAVHHFDEDHKNNEVDNLVPLCPTHHEYMHSKFRALIVDRVNAYVEEFRKRDIKQIPTADQSC